MTANTVEPPPRTVASDSRCPCLSGSTYGECCGPIHAGTSQAATAERLMRSRFSAFATDNSEYLLDSWHASTRPDSLELDRSLTWFRLDILSASGGGLLDSTGAVDFEAFYREETPTGRVRGSQQERSSFVKEGGRWYYVGALELNEG